MSRQTSGYTGGKSGGNDYYRGNYGSSRRGKPYDHHQHYHQGSTRYDSSANANYDYKSTQYPSYPSNYQYDAVPQQPPAAPMPVQPPQNHAYAGSQVGYDNKAYAAGYDQNQSGYSYPQEVNQHHYPAQDYPRYDDRTATYDDKYSSYNNQPPAYEAQDSRYDSNYHPSPAAGYQGTRAVPIDSRYDADNRYSESGFKDTYGYSGYSKRRDYADARY